MMLRVSAANGLNSTLENQINIDASPTLIRLLVH
jgi:hypothetical protein